MDKKFLAVLGALIIIFGGIFVFSRQDNKDKTNTDAQPTNHVKGNGAVRLIEYGDYQCIACKTYEPVVQQVIAKYAKDVSFQFRNLPLVNIHPNAFSSARAAEAAALQNKFWEMHDELYKSPNWEAWTKAGNPTDLYNSYAQAIGLNVEQFKADYASGRVNDAINADLAEFAKSGRPQATPSFFLDGQPIENNDLVDPATNAPSLSKFSALIEAAIKKQKAN